MPSPPPATGGAPAAFLSVCRRLRRHLFHDKAGDIVFRAALAPLALAAALLAIPADQARAHNNSNSATLHAENYPLHRAVESRDIDELRHLLTDHAAYYSARPLVTLNALDDQGRTALHIAATITMGMFAVSVVDAFARGEDGDGNPLSDLGEQFYTLWNAPDGQGRTPLRAAADNENWAMVARLFEYGGGYPHWGEECAYPLVANPTYGREPAGGQCVCADDSRYTKTNLGECEAVARCAAPAVRNAGTNRCDCPAPNVGADGADAPGDCAAASAESCGGLTPPAFYNAAAKECAPFADCPALATLNRAANLCECAGAAVLDGAGTGCLCESPNVGTPGDCAVPSAESCGGLTPAKFYDAAAAAGECVPFVECAAPSVLNAGANLCDCPAPNVGPDRADAPGDCVAASAESCGGLTPAKFYDAAAGECVAVADCAAPAVLNAGANLCDCPAPNAGTDGADAPGNCAAASAESCGGLTPAKFYDSAAGECVAVADCAAPAVLNAGANLCDCPAPNVGADGADAPGECAAPSAQVCGGLTPAKFYDSAARECVPFVECAAPSVLYPEANDCHAKTLHEAAQTGDLDSVNHFITVHMANVNVKSNGRTPLHLAASRGHVSIVSALIAAGANVNAKDNFRGETPLQYAASGGHISIVSALIAAGAGVNFKDNYGKTPLHLAASGGHVSIVATLIAAGANVNVRGRFGYTPLHDAAYSSRVSVVFALIAAGADVNAKTTSRSYTPLHRALSRSSSSFGGGANPPPLAVSVLVATLIAAGADVNAKDNFRGETPLHYAVRYTNSPHFFVAPLIAAGADVNVKNNGGLYTPLHYAAQFGHAVVIPALVAAGADVNAKSINGYTPLYNAIFFGTGGVAIPALIAAGADVNLKNNGGETPLHRAVFYGAGSHKIHLSKYVPMMTMLIAAGADVNLKNNSGETPLHIAHNSRNNRAALVPPLIAAGGRWGEVDCANGNVVNPAGPSPPCICQYPKVETNLGVCEVVAECASPSVLNAGANRCDCPAPNVGTDGADAPGDCAVPSAESCGGLTPAKFYDAAAGECVAVVDCAAPAVLNAGANLCDCPAPNVGADEADAPGDCVAASAQVCGGLTPPQFYAATLSACVAVAECAAPSVLNAGANRCDCPAPNVGTDGADAPGDCVAPSAESCGGLTPPQFYAATLSACVAVAECAAPSVLNAGANRCDCPAPNVGADGADAPGDCVAASAESCGGLTPPAFYNSAAGECVAFADCQAGATLDGETNTCECAPPSALDGTGLGCECLAPNLDFGGGDCRPPTTANCAEHYDPPRFFDPAAGECGARLYPCHDSAVVKADNSGCECPAGTFAHGDPSDGVWDDCARKNYYGDCVQRGGVWRKIITLSAVCHADHAPIQHNIDDWLSAVFANNPTLVAHFISDHKQDPDGGNFELHSAARNGYYSVAKALIEGGADIERKRSNNTPLHEAVKNGRGPLITLLLQRGADADAAGGGNNTPLHLAARRTDTAENVALIAFLLDKGADPNTRNDSGWRPLDLAYDGGNAATWQARRGIMAALIDGGANWGDSCRGEAIPNRLYDAADVARYPRCGCPLHISERDSFGACECPAHSHAQVNGRCLPKDSAQVEAEILKMETELLRLRAALVSLNAKLTAAAEMPREMVEEIAEQAGDTAKEIKRRRDNFLALARADLAGPPPPPVAMSDTEAECRMLGGEVRIHSATGIRVCSGIDGNDTFCLVDSGDAYPCRGLFRHVRTCNDDYNRPALNPFFCGPKCGERSAVGNDCE